MQVSVEATSDLARTMTVQVPEEKIQEAVSTRMKKLAQTTNLAGFRPGKVPQRVLKNKFGGRVRAEVLAELIQSSFHDALKNEKIHIVGQPEITPQESAEGKGLEYVASFEILPEIALNGIAELKLKRPVCEITEADIDSTIESLREQRKSWNSVDRPAQLNDRVTINFQGKSGDEDVTGGQREKVPVVLGSNEMMPGFENHLLGAETGADLNFEIEFPHDYGNAQVANKSVEFHVQVVQVEEGQPAEIDAAFFKSFGVEDGNLETFRQEVKASISDQIQQAVQWRMKQSVIDALGENIALPSLPETLVKEEISQMAASSKNATAEEAGDSGNGPAREQFEGEAKKRVALGLIIGEIVNANGLSVDHGRVNAIIRQLAQSSPNADHIVDWYNANPEQKQQIERRVLEDQAVEWVLKQAQVIDETVSLNELVGGDSTQPAVAES